VSGGTTIEAPKARASRRQRHRVGWGMGRGVRSSARGPGPGAKPRPLSHFLHISGHRTLLVARKIRFSCPKYKFHFEKVVVTVTTTFKSGGDKSPSSHTVYKVAPMLLLYRSTGQTDRTTDEQTDRRRPYRYIDAYR